MNRPQIEADSRHQCRSTMVTFRNHGPNVTLYLENFAHSEPVPSGCAEMKQFMPFPDSNRAPLAGQHFQIAVIGGGIMGVAIAWELPSHASALAPASARCWSSNMTSPPARPAAPAGC